MREKARKARFSCVEIAVIVVMLGTVGAKVGPQLAEASSEEKVVKLIDGLEAMRAQLDLYRAQHQASLPPADSFAGFKTALTTKVGQYGSYVKKIPVNPFNNLNTVRFDGEAAGAGMAGWRLDTATGLLQADNNPAHAAL